MPLSQPDAAELIRTGLKLRDDDAKSLDRLRDYRRGKQPHPVLNDSRIPQELTRFISLSRVNIVEMVVEVLTQSLYVDGYRPNVADVAATEESPAWGIWQANRLDSRQSAIYRGAFTYGAAYVVVLPGELRGEPTPVIRGVSPRNMTALYGTDPDWPIAALEVTPNGEHFTYKLYDEEAIYTFTSEGDVQYVTHDEHGMGVTPVVRFVNMEDLDDDLHSEVEHLIELQDQVDVTTFGLMVAQHYQAFIQRYIIGWEAESEAERLKAAASRLWTFKDDEVQVGQFQQAQLDGYLKSREDSVELMAVLSQTPPHHLLGKMINLSAEALAAAESGHRRKITQRQTTFGEAWEQVFSLVEDLAGQPSDAESQVRWKDTEARSLAQTVDALGKMAEMLGIPPEALWERIPGATQQDIQLWKQLAAEADAAGQALASLIGSAGIPPSQPQPPQPPEVPVA